MPNLCPKILFCMHMPPPVHGAAMMGQYIHDSALINETFECEYINIATAKDINDIGRGGMKKIVRFVQKLRIIKNAIAIFHPDIVYVTPASAGLAFYKDFVIVQLLKRLQCNVVLHYHNKGVAQNSKKWYNRRLYNRFFKNVNVILLSDLLYSDIAAFVPREKVVICPNGIPDVDRPIQRNQQDKVQVLFLSNLIRSKGIMTLLDALELLNKDEIFCIIAGAPGDVSEIQLQSEILKRGLQDVVTYIGRVNTEQKRSLFAKTNIFVHPTENDCFPLVLLEAMRCGIPCVATSEGAISDIIENGETGWLIEKRNPKVLAEKMAWLIDHPQQMLQMGKNGRARFVQSFTSGVFEQNIVKIIGELKWD